MKTPIGIVAAIIVLMLAGGVRAETPHEQLKRMEEMLRNDLNDRELRKNIIKLVRDFGIDPAGRDEAERLVSRGLSILKETKPEVDYEAAINEFEQAMLVAPWYGDAYYGLGMALNGAGQYDAALRNLKLALLASPGLKELSDLIFEIEYREKLPEMIAIHDERYNFEIGKTEVTFRQWDACVADGGCAGYLPDDGLINYRSSDGGGLLSDDGGLVRGDFPVASVSYDDAQRYIEWLNRRTARQYRLPGKEEWIYACRGGDEATLYCGRGGSVDVGWFYSGGGQPHPVGQKQANGYGLYDMSGNMWEWTEECFGAGCQGHVLRGGSWNNDQQMANSPGLFRGNSARRFDFGFRLVRTLP